MSIPNLDAMGHQWFDALAQFNFELEYQKGGDNMVAGILSWVTTWLNLETVKSTLKGVTLGMAHQAEVNDPAMVEGDQHLEQEVYVATGCPLVEMYVTNWAEAQKEDLMLSTVLDWLKAWKQTDLKIPLAEHAFGEAGKLILWNWHNLMIHQGALYLCSTPKFKIEYLLLCMGATEMQDINGMIIPCAYCGDASGGQEWPTGAAVHKIWHALLSAWG